jgi:hypothetical protein
VPDALAPIADKLRHLARMLSSDRDGEIVAAARALNRTLKSVGLDIHAFADSIGQINSKKFTEADALEIYRRGVEDGRREAENNQDVTFHNITTHDEPSWHDIACKCARYPDRLYGEHEKDFVDDMVRRTVHGGRVSQKQGDWLRKIYARVRQ